MRAGLYRRYALECFRFAGEMADPSCKTVLLDMAQSWLRLAEQAEKNAKADLVDEPLPPRLGAVG
jgi:hypothetical protein